MSVIILDQPSVGPPPPVTPPPLPSGPNFTALAVHDIRVSWDKAASNSGWFIVGSSLLSGPDLLAPASQLVPTFTGPFDNVTRYVTDASWSRGRSSMLDEVQQGKWTATLRDPDGRFNPNNPASPLYGDTNQPGRPIRHRAYFNGVWYPQFYGFLRTLEYEPTSRGRGLVHLAADDLFVRLDIPSPDITPRTNTTTGAIIGAVLNAIGWGDPLYRRLAVGDSIVSWPGITGGASSALQLISELLAAELGLFYIDAAGVAVYESRNARATTPLGYTISQSMRALAPGMDLDKIGNKATSTKSGGPPQTYTDAVSADPVFGFGPRELPTVESPYFTSDSFAFSHAQYRVNQRKDPIGSIWSLKIDNRAAALLTALLDIDISDRVLANEAETGSTFDGFIERVERSVTTKPYSDTANYVLSSRTGKAPFIIGSSLLSGIDTLVL